jgi:hypothetical protein
VDVIFALSWNVLLLLIWCTVQRYLYCDSPPLRPTTHVKEE